PLLGWRYVPTGVLKDLTEQLSSDQLYSIPRTMWTYGPQVIWQATRLPNGQTQVRYWVPMVDKSTGQPIGGMAEVYQMHFLESFLHFSTELGFLKFEWWRFVGFQ